jgi:hypothetical protein
LTGCILLTGIQIYLHSITKIWPAKSPINVPKKALYK